MTTDYLIEKTLRENERWIEEHPNGTLGELLTWIDQARQQCWDAAGNTGDAVIEAYMAESGGDVPEPLATELEQWDSSDPEATFTDRAENLDEYISDLEMLIDEFGLELKLAELALVKQPA